MVKNKALCRWAPFAALVLLFAIASSTLAAPEFPTLTGRVVDQADLLSEKEEQWLTSRLSTLEHQKRDQLVVVTVASLQGYAIDEYGYQLGRHWGIGQEESDNGLLLIVAPNEREVRIEVGYGLEGTVTDAISANIIQNLILPNFREGNYALGIQTGVDALLDVLGGTYEPAPPREKEREKSPLLLPLVIFAIFAILSGFGGGGGTGVGRGLLLGAALGGFGRGGGGGGGGGGFGGGGGGFGGGGASGGW